MTTKYLKQVSGVLTEVATVSVSAGAADVDKIASLNASGVFPLSITNGVAASAGSGDAGKVAALDGTGRLDTTMMPVGIGADTATVQASETIAAGDYVNIHNVSGAVRVRKADASNGRRAHGFTLAGITSGASGTVYFEGQNTQVSSLTPGATQFLSGSAAGAGTETAPTTTGWILQVVGNAIGTTAVNFEPAPPITLV